MKNLFYLFLFFYLVFQVWGDPIRLIESKSSASNGSVCTILKFTTSNTPNAPGEAILSLKNYGFVKGFPQKFGASSRLLTISNKEGTIIGYNFQPCTNRNEIYLLAKNSEGDLFLFQDINDRISKLFPKNPDLDPAELFLDEIRGDVITLFFRPLICIKNGIVIHGKNPIFYKIRLLPSGQFKFIGQEIEN